MAVFPPPLFVKSLDFDESLRRLEEAFFATNEEGEAIILAVAESISANPKYHQDVSAPPYSYLPDDQVLIDET